MDQVSATRSELLARRAQIGLAGQGRDLLGEKRAALMRELEQGAAVSRRAMGEAVAFDGAEAVGSAAVAAASSVGVGLHTRWRSVPASHLPSSSPWRSKTRSAAGSLPQPRTTRASPPTMPDDRSAAASPWPDAAAPTATRQRPTEPPRSRCSR